MARYDAGWGWPGPGGYDRGFRPGGGWGEDRDFGSPGGSRWESGRTGYDSGIYGPARYGLGPYHHRLRTRRRDDGELKSEVQDALFFDTWVDAESIQVEVKEGVVTLRGELPNYEEIRYATDDAWDVDGVVGVRSELSVKRQ